MTKEETAQLVTEIVDEICNHYNSDLEKAASAFAASIINDVEKIITEVIYSIAN